MTQTDITSHLNLPRDRMTMNAWNRSFFDTNPIVKSAITFHATNSISKIDIKCKHNKVEQFFNDMADRLDLFDVITNAAFEFYKLGEVFLYAEVNPDKGVWDNIVIQNPDYIIVKKDGFGNTSISLRSDELIKKLVMDDTEISLQMPENIRQRIKNNEPIPLDSLNVSHLKMLSSPYDIRGTGMIVGCFKDLLIYNKLMESTDNFDSSYFNSIRDNIYTGLMVSKSIIEMDSPIPANLGARYMGFRNMIQRWLGKKIFAPISEIHGFYELNGQDKVLIVPEISWVS